MQEITYWYSDPGGNIRENQDILPLSELENRHRDRAIFRFAYDQRRQRIYIQDATFREAMAAGDQGAWQFVNNALRFLGSKFGAKFLDRAYGDPPGSKKRVLSDYAPAWRYLSEFLREEMGTVPTNLVVCEYVDEGHNEHLVSIEPPGRLCEGQRLKEPCIRLNRYAHKNKSVGPGDGDVDFLLLNELLTSYYLRNIERIADVTMDDTDLSSMEDVLVRHNDPMGYDLMFAHPEGQDVRIFKANDNEMDEEEIRENGLEHVEHVVLFSYEPNTKQIFFHNYTPMDMAKDDKLAKMLSEIKKLVSRSSKVPENEITYAFDPSLASPFISRLSRYRIPWLLGQEEYGDRLKDLPVVEAPLAVEDGLAALVRSASEENQKAPRSRRYRVRHGMDVPYPFLLVDNRTQNLGLKYRGMLEAAVGEQQGQEPTPTLVQWAKADRDFLMLVRQPDRAAKAKASMRFMLRMGMPRRHVLDFFAPRYALLKRAEYSKLLKQAWKEAVTQNMEKTAAIGPSYDVNSWWHIGLQEELNRSSHTGEQDQKKAVEPFNLRSTKKRPAPKKKPYEALLDPQRDDELGYLKTTEQLLRESRI